jgi:hypothetical protein
MKWKWDAIDTEVYFHMAGEYYRSIDGKQAFSWKQGVTVQTMLTADTYSPAVWRNRYAYV